MGHFGCSLLLLTGSAGLPRQPCPQAGGTRAVAVARAPVIGGGAVSE